MLSSNLNLITIFITSKPLHFVSFSFNCLLLKKCNSITNSKLYTVFSDYYHEKTENNDYLETRKIRDDFGKDLFDCDCSEDEWNADFNFFAQCIKFYLSVQINPPMGNVTLRNLLAEMTQPFKDWADAYFDTDGGNVDKVVAKDEALTDFMQKTKTKGWTTNKFT